MLSTARVTGPTSVRKARAPTIQFFFISLCTLVRHCLESFNRSSKFGKPAALCSWQTLLATSDSGRHIYTDLTWAACS